MTTDVLRLALDRRDELQAEIDRLDTFIRTAEQLIRSTGAPSGPRPAFEDDEGQGTGRMNLLRRGAAAG